MRKIQKGHPSVGCHSERISVVKDPVPQIKVLVSTADVENFHGSICVFIPEIK